jgi:hypothetical protein
MNGVILFTIVRQGTKRVQYFEHQFGDILTVLTSHIMVKHIHFVSLSPSYVCGLTVSIRNRETEIYHL